MNDHRKWWRTEIIGEYLYLAAIAVVLLVLVA